MSGDSRQRSAKSPHLLPSLFACDGITGCCHCGIGQYSETPPPLPFHPVSVEELRGTLTECSVVPPTAVANGCEDGSPTHSPLPIPQSDEPLSPLAT